VQKPCQALSFIRFPESTILGEEN